MTVRAAAPVPGGAAYPTLDKADSPPLGRWGQLILGVVCMSMIANLQYGWTLFVDPIQQKFGWERTAIQWAFTIFVVMETWLVPIEGWFVDRYGPRLVTIFGGVLCATGWTMNAYADSLTMLYAAAAVSGVGAGAVYGTCVGNALKWFPDRRGFAAGLTAAGFGAGSALTVIPIANMIRDSGYQHTFLVFGLGQGIIVVLAALFLVSPSAGFKDRMLAGRPSVNSTTRRQYSSKEMIQTPVFWLLYLMFVMMAAGGLMAAASLAPIAKDFKVAGVPVSLMGITLPALTFALTIDRVLNGVTRPFFGWVSDKIGRENTMFIAFMIEGVGILALGMFAHIPLAFVLLTGLVFFAWGEIYSLFPATCSDTYGDKNAAANAGLLYTAKGTSALLLPVLLTIQAKSGSWQTVFYAASGMAFTAGLLALFVLKPMRARFIARS
ncbi:oxalate/formate MFS antiporter [Methylobacterium sp. BTF04]|uniref:oxalate/formate MFS antiporter n=1 Tax=Methylobacterium sp. BTF04 TaxID=2708300 RepID=UPI0013D372DC|nr:oxalate/formate MFS antiporter [Methylobacterium sp. BTF04]NEU10522.1 oxalate/formate MFS antiporter [Methylobacterium sp. BTF04]